MLEQILINGAMMGAIYALLAVGFSLIFGVARIINLAHTAFYMVAAYFIFTLLHLLGLNVLLSIAASIVITTALGVAIYKLVVERIREHEITVLLITVAAAMVFQECLLLVFGGHFRGISSYIPGFVELLGVRVLNQHLLTVGVVLVCLIGILAFLFKSKLGLAIRATAQDREITNLMGINVTRMCLISMAIAAGLAAVAGAMVAPILVLKPLMWLHPLIMVLAAVILGGLGSIKGSFAGAFILGYTEALVVFLIPGGAFLRGAVALAVMVVVLLIRPEGLFGIAFEEERL